MSVFFFRLHNLHRGSTNHIKNVNVHDRRNQKVYQHSSDDTLNTTSASKLFEKTPTNPKDRDSLDDVAIHIKRFEFWNLSSCDSVNFKINSESSTCFWKLVECFSSFSIWERKSIRLIIVTNYKLHGSDSHFWSIALSNL